MCPWNAMKHKQEHEKGQKHEHDYFHPHILSKDHRVKLLVGTCSRKVMAIAGWRCQGLRNLGIHRNTNRIMEGTGTLHPHAFGEG